MNPVLFVRLETRSTADVKIIGEYKYAQDATTQVLCCGYALGHDAAKVWKRGQPPLPELSIPDLVVVSFGPFDPIIYDSIMVPAYGWPVLRPEQWRSVQSIARALAFPASLDQLSQALGLRHRKDIAHHPDVLRMSRPRQPHASGDPNANCWHEDPEAYQALYAYNFQHLELLRECYYRLRPLPPGEEQVWRLDKLINARGVAVDRSLAIPALSIVNTVRADLDLEIAALTEGAVQRASNLRRIEMWLQQQGVALPERRKEKDGTCESTDCLDAHGIQALLETELSSTTRRVLEIRYAASQTTDYKVQALFDWCCADGRARGMLQYHGAATGRWSSYGPQLQNLKRPPKGFDQERAIPAIRTGSFDQMVRLGFPNPLETISNAIRSFLVADPGKVFVSIDFTAIEARILAWLADEGWKLQAFRDYDTIIGIDAQRQPIRKGPDIYLVTGAQICRIELPLENLTKDHPCRKVGKVTELAFGYCGGVRAFRKVQPTYMTFSDVEIGRFQSAWRAAHPKTVNYWVTLDRAAINAVRHRGEIFKVAPNEGVAYKVEGSYLLCQLPSGRNIAYPFPRLITVQDQVGRPKEVATFKDSSGGHWCDCRNGRGSYPGIWCENVVTGIARDLLVNAMFRLEDAGYKIVLTVHDEIVVEVDDGFGSLDEAIQIATTPPPWAEGLPLAAAGWVGERYGKD